VFNQLLFPLKSPVGDVADFVAVESLPFLAVQLRVEFQDADGVDEIDEGVADVALIFEVNW